jgi:TetR/AcrR family transcriptional repressor of nem operon
MRKSKADTAETRKRIVSMASRVFLTEGLAATGIADVMAAAGLTQGGFYRHFESREHLIAEANLVATERLSAKLDKDTEGLAPRDAIATIVRNYLSQLQSGDPDFLCPLANLGSELQHADEQVRATAADGHQRLVGRLAVLTEQLGLAEPRAVADAIVTTIVGAVTLSKLTPDAAGAGYVLANAQKTVDLLLAAGAK